MRFRADMGISMRTVEWLRLNGHDAVHLREQGLQRLPDDAIMAKARTEARIVITMDLDFGYLLAVSGSRGPSTVIFRLGDERSQAVNERLEATLASCGTDLQAGAIVSVSESAIRVRQLPIGP
jgi:predicted nuclease of predicted toxin-antitoxin system